MMYEMVRQMGAYECQFVFKEHEMLINVTHSHKSQMLFSRITDDSFPEHLQDICDNVLELMEVIKELADDKIVISPKNELVLIIGMGKKTKEFAIGLENAQISEEEPMKKKVSDLEKQLEKKTFEADFYKEQYQFLLMNLQLKPNVEELARMYDKGDVEELFNPVSMKKKDSALTSSSLSSSSVKVGAMMNESGLKVGSSAVREEQICSNSHPLKACADPVKRFKCNFCRNSIPPAQKRFQCRTCDFDICMKCSNIPNKDRKYCPKRHGLSFGNAGNYHMRCCDKCRNVMNAVERGFSCIPCDYDICSNCV